MKITFTDQIGLMTKVEIKLFQKKTADNVVPTAGFDFMVTDDQAERYKTMIQNIPDKFYTMIMKKQSDVNPPETFVIGKSPALDNTGKLKRGETFADSDADFTNDLL
ncbi:MAG: hypothetical protein JKY15_01995 [Deltaproteobacteria bacterium]|nr:hypothetical protein [Deltaproteobacteria bacterium]